MNSSEITLPTSVVIIRTEIGSVGHGIAIDPGIGAAAPWMRNNRLDPLAG
jgi:hypothetical protein